METNLRIEHRGNKKRLVRNKARYGPLDILSFVQNIKKT